MESLIDFCSHRQPSEWRTITKKHLVVAVVVVVVVVAVVVAVAVVVVGPFEI